MHPLFLILIPFSSPYPFPHISFPHVPLSTPAHRTVLSTPHLLLITTFRLPRYLQSASAYLMELVITQAAELLVKFSCGELFNLTFYVTPLDSSCSSVLGYNWLRQYNPLIDWSSGHITFRSVDHRGPAPLTSPVAAETLPHQPLLVNTPSDPAPIPAPTPDSHTSRPHISMINVAAYLHASKLPGSVTFQLQLSPDGTLGWAVQEVPPDLSSVPEDYHEFADVFSKGKADTLPPHHSYDLKINLEEGTPPPNHMYSLSQSELETL